MDVPEQPEEHVPSLYCYRHKGCRRPECRALNTDWHREWRARSSKMDHRMIPHGLNGYRNYKCRCEVCKKAKSEDNQQNYRRSKWVREYRPGTPEEAQVRSPDASEP